MILPPFVYRSVAGNTPLIFGVARLLDEAPDRLSELVPSRLFELSFSLLFR
jgi:hypothetical protein